MRVNQKGLEGTFEVTGTFCNLIDWWLYLSKCITLHTYISERFAE